MLGYQAAGAAPIVRGKIVENPETVATAIRIGNPASWELAVNAQRESGGWFADCTDEEILHVQKLLARTEGVFCEPASAISLAGVLKDLEQGRIGEGTTIVCTLTGHGLKDPDTAIAQCVKPVTVDAELSEIEALIREHLS
jgi:threonine synthase